MNIEIGQYVSNGKVNLIVGDIQEYKGKTYALLVDEKNELLYFCELERKEDGWNFNRVTSDSLTQQLLIHFSGIKQIIEDGKLKEFIEEGKMEGFIKENGEDVDEDRYD